MATTITTMKFMLTLKPRHGYLSSSTTKTANQVVFLHQRYQQQMMMMMMCGGWDARAALTRGLVSHQRQYYSSSTSVGAVEQTGGQHHPPHFRRRRSVVNSVASGSPSSSTTATSNNSTARSTAVPSWPVIHQQQQRARRRVVSPSSTLSRSSSSMPLTSVTSWLKDVIRTGSLSPPNPILKSLQDARGSAQSSNVKHQQQNQQVSSVYPWQRDASSRIKTLPKFRHVKPYHLVSAAKEVRQQYQIELAELEVKLTSLLPDPDADASEAQTVGFYTVNDLLLEMERIEAPIIHLMEVANLYKSLAATPDLLQEWDTAIIETLSCLGDLQVQMYRSKIIYEALRERQHRGVGASPPDGEQTLYVLPPHTDLRFRQQGVHLIAKSVHPKLSEEEESQSDIPTKDDQKQQEDDEFEVLEKQEQLQQIQSQLEMIYERLSKVRNYDSASKASRLQCVSDMYNCIGFSQLQARILGYPSVVDMSRTVHRHVAATAGNSHAAADSSIQQPIPPILQSLFDEIGDYLQPFLPHQVKLNLDIVGSFLGDESKKPAGAKSTTGGPTEQQIRLYEARHKLKQNLRLHGVIQGLCDFCEAIFGLRVDVMSQGSSGKSSEGWNKNVRILHIYQKQEMTSSDDSSDDPKSNTTEKYLGAIYLDPFRDNYFRSDDAKELVTTRLLTKNLFQASAPVGVVALKVGPTWDDDPAPITWDDLREFLHNFGKALQLILTQNARQACFAVTTPPDTSDVLAHFMEMWVQNDGFLQRLVQLSQDPKDDPVSLDDDTLDILRKDLKKEKALEIMNMIFLSALQLKAFGSFDPRGDETLMALQTRLAEEYLPKGNLPDSSDLSPLLAVFQENAVLNTMSATGPIFSEILAAMLYESFQNTDLRNREAVERLGFGIRDLFLQPLIKIESTPSSPALISLGEIEKLCGTKVSGGQLQRVYKFHEVDDDATTQ